MHQVGRCCCEVISGAIPYQVGTYVGMMRISWHCECMNPVRSTRTFILRVALSVVVYLIVAPAAFRSCAAVALHPTVGLDAVSTNRLGVGAPPDASTAYTGRRLQQTVFTQLRPMSDTTQCLGVPMADYTNGRQLALAPCVAVPEQNFSLPVAGQTLHI